MVVGMDQVEAVGADQRILPSAVEVRERPLCSLDLTERTQAENAPTGRFVRHGSDTRSWGDGIGTQLRRADEHDTEPRFVAEVAAVEPSVGPVVVP